jgi:hypothetical protein
MPDFGNVEPLGHWGMPFESQMGSTVFPSESQQGTKLVHGMLPLPPLPPLAPLPLLPALAPLPPLEAPPLAEPPAPLSSVDDPPQAATVSSAATPEMRRAHELFG